MVYLSRAVFPLPGVLSEFANDPWDAHHTRRKRRPWHFCCLPKHFAVYYLGTDEHAVAVAVGVKRQMSISENGTSTTTVGKTHGLHDKAGRSP